MTDNSKSAKYPVNLQQVRGRLVRNANFSDKHGKALFGTLKVVSDVPNRFGDAETKTYYVEFRITDPALVEEVNKSPTVEGVMLALAGRAYTSEDREVTDEATGEVKRYRGQATIVVEAGGVGHYAVNLGR